MTRPEAESLLRQVLREELAPLLARLDAMAPAAEPSGNVADPVAVWLGSAPVGLTGSAAALLPDFLASGPPPRPDSRFWTAPLFGRTLAALRGRRMNGRFLTRRPDRKGVYTWTVEGVPESRARATLA